MKHFDEPSIQTYINRNPIEMNAKMFRDNIIICNALTFLTLMSLSVRGLLFGICISLDLSFTIVFIMLKKRAENVVSYYLCQGMTSLYISFYFCVASYMFYTDVHGSNGYLILNYILLYSIILTIAVLLEFRKINSIKQQNEGIGVKKRYFFIPAALGIVFARFIGDNFAYNETLTIASAVGVILAFVFSLPVGYIIKAYFIYKIGDGSLS